MTPTQYMPPRSLSLVGLLQRIYFADPLTCKDSSEVRSRTQTPNNLRKAKELQTRHRKCAHWICRQPGCSNLFAIARSTVPPCALLHPASLLSLSDCMTNSDRKPVRCLKSSSPLKTPFVAAKNTVWDLQALTMPRSLWCDHCFTCESWSLRFWRSICRSTVCSKTAEWCSKNK